MTVEIPVTTKYDGRGIAQAEKDFKRLQAEQIKATRAQISEHQRAMRLTAKLDKDLAKEREKNIQLAKEWGTAALAAGAILAKAGFDAVQAAKESTLAETELLGVLNSTGKGAAGFKDQLTGLATALEDNSNFTDEAVQHAEALLLTFDRVGRDVMPRATQATADLAQLMGGDLAGAAKQVGKALDGQISALKKSGVSFTESQEKQIKALFDTGQAAQAQDIILSQLEKQVAGQAKIAREAAGGWKDMEVSAGRLQEAVGSLLLTMGDGGATDVGSGFLDRLTGGAKAWEGAIENMRLLAEARERAAKDMGVQASAPRGAFGQIRGDVIDNEALAKAVREVSAEHAAAKAAAEGSARALKEEGDAADQDAAAQDKLADRLEKANAARREVAGKLIDITENAAADTAKTWDDYFKDEQANWKDHGKAVDKINADSAKEQQRIQKDLAKTLVNIDKDLSKDLAKIDKDLAKDKAKLQRDTDRQISRMTQDAARAEKQERRQQQIDAKGDQRLFDFEMRQLAAEGEFNQILAAQERRAIEQQINEEKAAEEQAAADENSKIEIDRVKQDAADRKAEMEAEAEEAKQLRMEQAEEARAEAIEAAAEAEERRKEELAQALADEQASYEERRQALVDAREQKLAEIEETKKQSIAKLAEELTQNKDLTVSEMEALIPVAAALGEDVGSAYAEGLNSGYARAQRISDMVPNIGIPDTGTPSSRPGAQNRPSAPTRPARSTTSLGTPFAGFAEGVEDFLVPPGFPNDSFQVGLTSGERVTVKPAGQGESVVVNVNGIGAKEFGPIMEKYAKAAVAEYHDTIITPWTNAG